MWDYWIAFTLMRTLATDTQRTLNRSLLPQVQSSMADSYKACLSVPAGIGKFDRMKHAMDSTTRHNVSVMFNASEIALLKGIGGLIEKLVELIGQTSATISKHLEDVYSIYWDDQNDQSKIVDPDRQGQVKKCRDSLLPDLNRLRDDLGRIQDLVGIERESWDLDIIAEESLNDTIKRKVTEAAKKGEIIDLCDSDVEIDEILQKLPPTTPLKQVKLEPNNDIFIIHDL